jgi:hypothetical protein
LIRATVLVADSVDATGGKLHLLGAGWNHILVAELPVAHGRLGIGILVEVPAEQAGVEHEIAVRLEDPDGQAASAIDGSFSVEPPPPGSPLGAHSLPIALNLDGVVFERSGAYRVVVTVNGVDSGEAVFAVLASSPA